MNEIDAMYVALFTRGMTALGLAIKGDNLQWAKAEYEFLHNIPSLISEPNHHRHQYFWQEERVTYLEWVENRGLDGTDAAPDVLIGFYDDLLANMEVQFRTLNWFAV
ncbi:MAG: hypothetical protein R3C19_10925 [Planctomycetaceae bacterium]